MSLFSDPVVLSDGTNNHSFSFRAQSFDKKNGAIVAGEWVEPAAVLAAESKIIVKHDSNSATTRRRLVSRKVNVLAGEELKPITINFTVTYNVLHTVADVQKEVNILTDAIAETSFLNNLCQGLI